MMCHNTVHFFMLFMYAMQDKYKAYNLNASKTADNKDLQRK